MRSAVANPQVVYDLTSVDLVSRGLLNVKQQQQQQNLDQLNQHTNIFFFQQFVVNSLLIQAIKLCDKNTGPPNCLPRNSFS